MKRNKKKSKAFMDLEPVCFGGESDFDEYMNSLQELEEVSDADFMKQFEFGEKSSTKEKVSDSKPIIPQNKERVEQKNGEKPRNRKVVTENFLAKKLIKNFSIGIYSKVVFIRNGNLYEQLTADIVMRLLNNMLEEKYLDQVTMKMCECVCNRVRALLSNGSNKLTMPETKMVFNNGIFDIRSGERVSPYEDVFSTVSVNATYCPDYKFDTPVWDAFMRDCSSNNKEIYKLIMTFVGYLLLPGAHAKNFFVLGTAKNSGKSMLAGFIRKLLPEDSFCAIAIDDFKNDFVLAQAVGKAINFAMDMPGGNVNAKNASVLKMITGGDPVTINGKYVNAFPHVLFSKLVFATNEMIMSSENDSAFWERMIIIPFLKSTPKEKQDPNLLEKLLEERDGIVNKALKYAKKLVDNDYCFPRCEVSERLKNIWMCGRCSGLYSFVNDCCIFQESSWTPTLALYDAYTEWCKMNAYEAVSSTLFSRTLRSVYQLDGARHSLDGDQYRGISGITLDNIWEV